MPAPAGLRFRSAGPSAVHAITALHADSWQRHYRGAFSDAFRLYANSVYESRLGEYKGEHLQVTSSIVRAPGDVVVDSQVVGGQVRTPVEVKWRVLREPDGRYRAVDVSIDGVWLAITEQQDFVSTLDNNHGDINVLIAQLRNQAGQPARRG